MEKSDDAFRTIGEMSKELGVKTHILRYWEEQFPTLNPLKRAGGRRHYRREDVALLKQINHLLNEDGYTIKGAIKALSHGSSKNGSSQGNGKVSEGRKTGIGGNSDADGTEFAAKAFSPSVQNETIQNETIVPGIDVAKLRALRERLASALAVA